MRPIADTRPTRLLPPLFALGAAVLLGGCLNHEVQFQRVRYAVQPAGGEAARRTSVVAVISEATLREQVPIHSFMAGIGNVWNVEPGQMLRDVVQTEFTQQFAGYRLESEYAEATAGRALTVVFTIPKYQFANFHAMITVHAVAYASGRRELLSKDYSAEGFTQGAKMFFGGAFAMKSALRQSSLDAYRKIFAELRPDLQRALDAMP